MSGRQGLMALQAFWGAWLGITVGTAIHYGRSARWSYAAIWLAYAAVAAFWIVRNVRRAA